MKKICLVNVGANSSHVGLRSPVFPDEKFEFIPIPDPFLDSSNRGLKYSELKSSNGVKIAELIQKSCRNRYVHNDPEFETNTYGDYPTFYPRAANLKRLAEGDFLFFFARLVLWINGKFTQEARFGFIGFIEIEAIYKDITQRPPNSIFRVIKNNAHILRGECNPLFYDGFWVFKGSTNSRRLRHTITFDREFIEECEIKDVTDQELAWDKFSSELSTIGSYFRSSRLIERKRQLELFWERVNSELYCCS
jgi:hypothetical protein